MYSLLLFYGGYINTFWAYTVTLLVVYPSSPIVPATNPHRTNDLFIHDLYIKILGGYFMVIHVQV